MDTDRPDVEPIWIVLETDTPQSGLSVTPTGVDVVAGPILAGIASGGRRHLLIPLGPGEAARVNTRGRAVHLTRATLDGIQYLGIICILPDVFTVFTQFVNELLHSISDSRSPARAAADLFDRWRTLFSETTGRGPLTEERIVGLLGELDTLTDLLAAGAPADLGFWTGPTGHIHDFRSPDWALEVKATITREGRILQISSIDQLDAPDLVTLWLIHRQYSRDPAGQNLAGAINAAESAGASSTALTEALRVYDIHDNTLPTLKDLRYRPTATRVYNVRSPHFPTITRSSFSGGDIPSGTLRLTYAIDLTNQPPTPSYTGAVSEGFAEFARDATGGLGT